MKLPGIKINRDSQGNPTSVTIRIAQYGEWLEDFIDAEYVKSKLDADKDTISWVELRKELLSKGGSQNV